MEFVGGGLLITTYGIIYSGGMMLVSGAVVGSILAYHYKEVE
jgi:hypothetical protein